MRTKGTKGQRAEKPGDAGGLAGWFRRRRMTNRFSAGRKQYYRSLAGQW